MSIEQQKAYYDKRWTHQGQLNSLQLRRAVKILDYFVIAKKAFKAPKVLDLGCGEGRLTSFLGEFAHVDGLELSEKAVSKARTLYPHVHFFHGNALTYEFDAEMYDVVVSQEVLEHIIEQEAYLNVCHRILKKGGYLILTTPNKRVIDEQWSRLV